MDRIQAMQMFMRVAEAGELRACRGNPFLPASTVTSTIKTLKIPEGAAAEPDHKAGEPYPEGMQYLAQCREILALIEHSESTLSESVARPQGACGLICPRASRISSSCRICRTFTGAIPIST